MPRPPGADTKSVGEFSKFRTTLEKIYGHFGYVLHHDKGTLDLYTNMDPNKFFTIYIAPPLLLDERIKKLNESNVLFDEFVKSIEKEKEMKSTSPTSTK